MVGDFLIRGAKIVSNGAVTRADLAIRGGIISALLAPGEEYPARETIDAPGRLIFPGLIDMHSHHREPGFTHKDDIVSVTKACAAGGVTTTVAMPNVAPPPNTRDVLRQMKALYEQKAIVDWNINPAATIVEEIPKLADEGILAFKIFMVVDTGRDYPHMPGIGVHDHGQIMEIMDECAKVGVPLMVHPHDQALMDYIERQFWARGERDALAYARAYAYKQGVIWETAVATLIRLQQATGVHLHLLHTQTSGTVQMIREAKARGQRVTAEINPWALFLGNDWANIERLGSYALSYWVPESNDQALWDGINDGTIDIIATDHASHTREEKEVGWQDGWKAHTGTPSAQFYFRMFLTAANQGKISYPRLAEAAATQPADLFGLKRKGRIAVGADADLVLVDPLAVRTIQDAEVHGPIGYTPYAGRQTTGLPTVTFLRGQRIFQDGQVLGQPGGGRQAVPTGQADTRGDLAVT